METDTVPGSLSWGTWSALLAAPTLTLLNLSITYSQVTPSCSRQSTLALHLVSLLTTILCAVTTLAALRDWRRAPPEPIGDAAAARPVFLALVAVMIGALSTLVVLAQWMPQWLLSPCAN